MTRLIVILFALLCTSTQMARARLYAVCVGVADYPGRSGDLRVSDEDARTMAALFRKAPGAHVELLTNGSVSRSALSNAMSRAFSLAGSDDTIILYFSGHGVPGGVVCYDGILGYQSIFQAMKYSRARRKMVFLDTCFSGKIRRNNAHSRQTYNDVMFFLSSRTTEKSLESPYRNSLFTIFLERGLRGGADRNRDKIITARELYDFVHYGVAEASGGKQHPVMWGNFDNNMTVIRWR